MAMGLLAVAFPGAAQPERSPPPVTAGLGAVASPSPYTGVDEAPLTVVPFVNLELDRFYLRGLEAGYRLTKIGPLTVNAVGQPRLQNFTANDSAALAGMTSRRRTAEAGFRGQLQKGRWEAGLRAVTDLLGRHSGQVVTAEASVRLGGPMVTVKPAAGIQWQSRDFVNYYSGVRSDEARAGRQAYTGKAATNPFVGASTRVRLGKKWGIFALVRHYWLDEGITDSPIVDTRTDYSGVLAVTRAFGS
ncbi:MipA/OmpV family protein [Thiohalorhabdus sp.]|uniref:MipA/OmpV family protein n=1 Tax=Thiohalorhabdus sp. TaxID=3094134 RepID=UPI002FC3D8FF